MAKTDVRKLLAREDKWHLGGGNRLIWAPNFPQWLSYPGLWDKAHFYNIDLDPGFTWTLVDEKNKVVEPVHQKSDWNPARLIRSFKAPSLKLTETAVCLPEDTLACHVEIKNATRKKKKYHFIAWTLQSTSPSKRNNWVSDVGITGGNAVFTKHLQSDRRPHYQFGCAFGISRKTESYCINHAASAVAKPDFHLTPFHEKFDGRKLPNDLSTKGFTHDGCIYIALHVTVELPPSATRELTVYLSAGPEVKDSLKTLRKLTKTKNPLKRSEKNWDDFFKDIPEFKASDKYLEKYYWYRWYGLKFLSFHGPESKYKHPAVGESTGDRRAPVAYSAMANIQELRWLKKPGLAEGSLLNFVETQREDGGFYGLLDVNYFRPEVFFHANWGHALIALFGVHNNKSFMTKVYYSIAKYADYFDSVRDPEKSGLYDVYNQSETGQKYMSRYLPVYRDADKESWGEVFRLKGIDATVYMYELKQALANLAALLKKSSSEIKLWLDGAERIKQAVLSQMWDTNQEMFFDVNPFNNRRTGIKSAINFYPYFTDIVEKEHVNGLKKHLLNPDEFWTDYPVPSLSLDDEYFSATGEWKNQRMGVPANGRVRQIINSHLVEALAITATRFNDDGLRKKAAELLQSFVKMMYVDGDLKKPAAYEHYNPLTGTPSFYRGFDEFQHSWIADLIIKYGAGVRAKNDAIIVDPFPLKSDILELDGIVVRGKRIKVRRQGKYFTVWVNGRKRNRTPLGTPVVIDG